MICMKSFVKENYSIIIFFSFIVLAIAFAISCFFETRFFIVQEKQITSDGYVLVIAEYHDHPIFGRYCFDSEREIVDFDVYGMYSVDDVVNYDDRNDCIILKKLN